MILLLSETARRLRVADTRPSCVFKPRRVTAVLSGARACRAPTVRRIGTSRKAYWVSHSFAQHTLCCTEIFTAARENWRPEEVKRSDASDERRRQDELAEVRPAEIQADSQGQLQSVARLFR